MLLIKIKLEEILRNLNSIMFCGLFDYEFLINFGW